MTSLPTRACDPWSLRPPESPETRRGRRIVVLLVAIALLSLGDLHMTLLHLTHAGMLEANPVARGVMSFGSPALLAAWKIVSVGVAAAIFYWARRNWKTEIAAWFCLGVLTWLTVHWVLYSDQIAAFGCAVSLAEQGGAEWVSMADR